VDTDRGQLLELRLIGPTGVERTHASDQEPPSSLDQIDALEVTDDDAVGCGDGDVELGVAVATAATVSIASTMYVKVHWRHSSSSYGAIFNRGSTKVSCMLSELDTLDRVLYTRVLTSSDRVGLSRLESTSLFELKLN